MRPECAAAKRCKPSDGTARHCTALHVQQLGGRSHLMSFDTSTYYRIGGPCVYRLFDKNGTRQRRAVPGGEKRLRDGGESRNFHLPRNQRAVCEIPLFVCYTQTSASIASVLGDRRYSKHRVRALCRGRSRRKRVSRKIDPRVTSRHL